MKVRGVKKRYFPSLSATIDSTHHPRRAAIFDADRAPFWATESVATRRLRGHTSLRRSRRPGSRLLPRIAGSGPAYPTTRTPISVELFNEHAVQRERVQMGIESKNQN